MCVFMLLLGGCPERPEEDVKFPGVGVIGGEPPDMDPGN